MPFGSEPRESGIGLALSGGGFRAVLFHCGALLRLNQLGVLAGVKRISSVSGGSIVAGVLATRWAQLTFAGPYIKDLGAKVIAPLAEFASKTIDVSVIVEGAINPLRTAGEELVQAYRNQLGLGVRLKDLPDKGPRFVFNATNYASGVSFRFSKPYCGDYRIGLMRDFDFDVALAAGCSSAFPPVLASIAIDTRAEAYEKVPGATLFENVDFRKRLHLADGGVYDNLGLETVWGRYETVLVSDGGKPFEFEANSGLHLAGQLSRIREIGLNQALALRKRWFLHALDEKTVHGTYWGIDTSVADYKLVDSIPVRPQTSHALSQIRTRLDRFSEEEQDHLINWGYAVCDAAVRKHAPQLIQRQEAVEQPRPNHKIS